MSLPSSLSPSTLSESSHRFRRDCTYQVCPRSPLLAFIVRPTEELLFRGLIQTALNGPARDEGWRVQRGTVVGAILFGLYHLINLAYQSPGATLQQVLTAFVIGLVFGVLYDRTRNLVGASLAHSVADFSGTAIPLLAYFVANR